MLQSPLRGTPCLDRGTEAERAEHALSRPPGLSGLVSHPHAPRSFAAAVQADVWAPLEGPGVYLLQERCVLPGGVLKTRNGLLIAVDPERCRFQPVLTTPRVLVDRLIEHVDAAGVDPGGVCGLYRDEGHYLDRLVDARGNERPLVRVDEPLGGYCSIWRLPADEGVALMALIEGSPGCLVGDTALYRALIRRRGRSLGAQPHRPTVCFYNQRDFGITLTTTVRVYPMSEEFDLNEFAACLHQQHHLQELSVDLDDSESVRRFCDAVRMEGVSRRTIGVLARGAGSGWLVHLDEDERVTLTSQPQVPEVALEFDAEWVERGLVQRFLPASMHAVLSVRPDSVDVRFGFEDPRAAIAFVVNPPPKRLLSELSDLSWRLPLGALQIKPPPPRGLVVRPLPTAATP
ncbi:MAG: hypothetical protein AB7O52_04905 [Planctomycetota bacterium]